MTDEAAALVFWGVRGTSPTPDAQKLRYGGHSICASVSLGPREHLILDCGGGLKLFGDQLSRDGFRGPREFQVLLSHYHHDHLSGLPFFEPLYDPESTFTFHGFETESTTVRSVLEAYMAPPYFPISLADVRARLNFVAVNGSEFAVGRLKVNTLPLHHPGGSLAYRLDNRGRRLVFANDHEHGNAATDSALIRFSEGVEHLIYDATYTPSEYDRLRKGWGHSTWKAAVVTARAAAVKNLVLFHHNPDHTDEDLDRIEQLAKAEFPATVAAREGMVLTF